VESQLGFDRTVFLPAVALSLGDLEAALMNVVTAESRSKLGKITYTADPFLSDVVGSFPTKIDAERAMKLGIPAAPNAEALVREYAADFPTAVAAGIEFVPLSKQVSTGKTFTLGSSEKVAVVTGGGSGIGRAVAGRLSRGGWTVVLAGRRLAALQETAALLAGDAKCLCVQTDVTVENDVERLFQTAESQFGGVHLLFNNAGVNSGAAIVQDVDSADFERVVSPRQEDLFVCSIVIRISLFFLSGPAQRSRPTSLAPSCALVQP
jgi:hypothetical protein